MLIRAVLASLSILAVPLMPVAAQNVSSSPALASNVPETLNIPAPDGRMISMRIWPAADEKGIVVFSHGYNGSPEAYQRILSAWAEHGYTVVAPLHVDSLLHADHAQYDNQAAFSARLMDLAVARAMMKQAHPGKPMIVAGHSFGSLMSTIEAGAVTVAGPQGDPDVKGVIAFSTAGNIPGVVTPQTYETLDVPLLVITGDRDVVPGYVADWQDHRAAFDLSPAGGKMLVTVEGGDHELVANADADDFALLTRVTEAFLDAHATNDTSAAAQLAEVTAPVGVIIERR